MMSNVAVVSRIAALLSTAQCEMVRECRDTHRGGRHDPAGPRECFHVLESRPRPPAAADEDRESAVIREPGEDE